MATRMAHLLFLLLIIPSAGFAEYCPQKIAFFSDAEQYTKHNNTLEKVYYSLECYPEFIYMHTVSSLKAFNNKEVDGEAIRIPIVEELYTAPFVRSEVPLFITQKSLWAHPDEKIAKTQPIGVLVNAVWQQNFVASTPAHLQQIRYFSNYKEIFSAFEQGQLGQFLTIDAVMQATLKNQAINVNPKRVRSLGQVPLHHYLHQDYAEFMHDFSNYVAKHDPFNIPQSP